MTLGQYRVGLDFTQNAGVTEIKQAAAELIDLCDAEMGRAGDQEFKRLWALAMTHFEDGAMWAVKAATKKPK